MDLDGFWDIVESARQRCDGDWTGVPTLIRQSLAQLPLSEIADFAQIQDRLEWDAYRRDMWTACRLINGGFGSDDGFLYFRSWLIVQGRGGYEAALANPDSLADLPTAVSVTATDNDFADCEALLYVANEAWEAVTGDEEGLEDELESRGFDAMRDNAVEPSGPRISFKKRDQVFAAMPRLAALFYDRAIHNRRSL